MKGKKGGSTMDKMMERLDTIVSRRTYLEKMMELPQVASDFTRYRQYAKEKAQLDPVADLYEQYRSAVTLEEEAKHLLKDTDEEIREMGRNELLAAQADQARLLEEIQVLLLPRDPNDEKNVIVEIRGATGGDEANIFAGDLFRMYTRYAETKGWEVEMISASESAAGGFSLVSFMIRGKRVFSALKYESGAHRVQRVPKTEASGRIHTSVATVLVMPEADDVDVQINPMDLGIDYYRASGAGGQHINKTESAVRITHLPTGIVVTCQEGRSQHENKDKAMAVLRTRVYDYITQQVEQQRGQERRMKIGTGERSEKVRTYNYPQNRVTDHRIGFTIQQLDRVMEGDLDTVLSALSNEDQKRKIAGAGL